MLVMGLMHESLAVHGVQFHPESIASEHGHLILKNFLDIAAAWNKRSRPPRGAGAAARGGIEGPPMADEFKALIAKVATGASLTREEAAGAFDRMMSGEATPSQMGGLLMALRVRGETVDEITGAVTTMRAKMLGVKAPPDAVDVVGTGGDASGSFNISTCAAFIVAGAGVPVAKHGNRALSSKSGAADVLAALGVKIDLDAEQVGKCIRDAGIGFMFAPAHHPAMKNVGPTRVELGTRTIFNLLGPLSNPASVKRQMIGTFSQAVGGADGASLEEPRLGNGLGGARLRRARRDHHVGADQRGGARRTARSGLSRSRRRTPACRAPSRRRCAAAMPSIMPRRCSTCSRASRGRSATWRS